MISRCVSVKYEDNLASKWNFLEASACKSHALVSYMPSRDPYLVQT